MMPHVDGTEVRAFLDGLPVYFTRDISYRRNPPVQEVLVRMTSMEPGDPLFLCHNHPSPGLIKSEDEDAPVSPSFILPALGRASDASAQE